MFALINRVLEWLKSLFWKEEMELTLVGLQYSGKTTFVNVIAVSLVAKRVVGCHRDILLSRRHSESSSISLSLVNSART